MSREGSALHHTGPYEHGAHFQALRSASHLRCFALRPAPLGEGQVPEGDAKRGSDTLQVWMVADDDGNLTSQLPLNQRNYGSGYGQSLAMQACALHESHKDVIGSVQSSKVETLQWLTVPQKISTDTQRMMQQLFP